jgi:hypothetical protein
MILVDAFAYVLLAIALAVIYGNWILLVRNHLQNRGASLIPFIGGVLGFVGCAVHPLLPWYWGLAAIAVDPGCGVLQGLAAIARLTYRRVRGSLEP